MPVMAVGDIYECRVVQLYGNQVIENTFYYLSNIGASSAFDLGLRIDNQIIPSWSPLVVDDLFFDSVGVRNLFNLDDAAIYPIAISGAIATDGMPPHACLYQSFGSNRASIKNSRKMFAGLAEVDQVEGIWDAGAVTAWSLFGVDVLIDDLIGQGGGDAYTPIVVKRIKYTTSGGNEAYRLPVLPSEADYGVWESVTTSNLVRTQRSRRIWQN